MSWWEEIERKNDSSFPCQCCWWQGNSDHDMKSAKPRCFKFIDINNLPVSFFSQPKAWMTADILVSVLTKLNRKL